MRTVLVVATFLLAVAAACGEAPRTPDARARVIEGQVWSPYCAGTLLTECQTRQSDELRVEIRRRIQSGHSDKQVLAWLRDNYGDEVLARPAGGPLGVAVWLVPVAALAAGAIVVGGAVRRWRVRPAAAADAGEPSDGDDEWRRRVREEVERGL